MVPDHKYPKIKSKSVKSFFWRNTTHEGKMSKNKRFHCKSFQQFKSAKGGENETHNLLQQSYNFTVIRSLNLHSSHFNNSKGFGKMTKAYNTGRANTARNNDILKKSFMSLNQNKINLNQPRVDVR